MAQLNWKEFFRQHPLFSSLTDAEIARLLDEKTSRKRDLPPAYQVIKQGEVDNSFFVIGEGAVAVGLQTPDGNFIPVADVRKGGFFGEMALIEQRARSATVVTKDASLLLQIQGDVFLGVLDQHPELQFKLLRELSERLRKLTEHALTIGSKDVDEKLALFNAKLDAELKAVNASMVAAQAVFDQVSRRADEVITSAERRRSQLTVAASAAGVILTALVSALGFFGYNSYADIKQTIEERAHSIDTLMTSAKDATEKAQAAEASAASAANDAKAAGDQAAGVARRLAAYQAIFENVKGEIAGKLAKEVPQQTDTAVETYRRALQIGDPNLMDEIFNNLINHIVLSSSYRASARAFARMEIDGDQNQPIRERFCMYYVLLISMILDDQESTTEYQSYRGAFDALVHDHAQERVKFPNDLTPQEIRRALAVSTLSPEVQVAKLGRISAIYAQIPTGGG
jgi:CRP-like cAMP-binding protein